MSMLHKNENYRKKDGFSQTWGRQIQNPQLLSFQMRYGMSFDHSEPFQQPVGSKTNRCCGNRPGWHRYRVRYKTLPCVVTQKRAKDWRE